MRIRGKNDGREKTESTINGVKVNAVIRWQGHTEKTKSQFNEELARVIVKGEKKWVKC